MSRPASEQLLSSGGHDTQGSPLHGVRVLDLSRVVAGNITSHLLADFGAEVIKIESLKGGDPLRAWTTEGVATHWEAYCHNKKSVCLNLREKRGRELLLQLVRTAHVLIENYRPGTLEDMGLGPDVLHGIRPDLVILRISGFGQSGPYRERPGFGTVVEAMSTFAAMNGFADREPVLPPGALADFTSGLYGGLAVVMALRAVESTGGRGEVIDLSLLEAFFAVQGPRAADYTLTGKVRPRTGNRSTTSAPRNVYATRDGRWLAISASTQETAERLFRAIEREDLITDPRFATNADRIRHVQILDQIIGAFVSARTQQECLAYFHERDIVAGPVYNIAAFMEDEHVRERGILREVEVAGVGRLPIHSVVPRMLNATPVPYASAPKLGEHTSTVLRALGVGEADIRLLAKDKVIGLGEGRGDDPEERRT